MTDPGGQYPYSQQPQYVPPAGRYVPPSLDEIYYKSTPNILLYIFTCGIWGAFWSYRTHEDLKRHNGEGLGGGIALLLWFFAGLVICFTVPMEIERAYNRNGWPSPVKATDGLWMLIPFAGPFIWYPKIQAALNSYWVSQGSRPLV